MSIINNTKYLIVTFSLGISLFFIAYFSYVFNFIKNNKLKFSFQIFSKAVDNNKLIKNIERRLRNFLNRIKNLTKKEKYLILAIVLFSLGMTKSIQFLHINLILGLVIGLLAVGFVERIRKNMLKTKKLKEVVTLFEGIEMYSKAGYSLIQSLKASKMLTNTITPSIDKCLSYWNVGPQKALEILKEELNLEETDSLILLMMHLESAGTKNLQGILQKEAHNIGRFQKMKTEIKIAHRPLILLVYKVLPIASFIGIVIGTLLFRMLYTFKHIGILQ